jgi:LDH2 family malate/lactate/ureidoglycolate dehydrogenase
MSGAVSVERTPLAALGKALLVAAGATPEHAGTVVDHLIEADTMGLKSHGMMRVPQYLDDIGKGGIDDGLQNAISHLFDIWQKDPQTDGAMMQVMPAGSCS